MSWPGFLSLILTIVPFFSLESTSTKPFCNVPKSVMNNAPNMIADNRMSLRSVFSAPGGRCDFSHIVYLDVLGMESALKELRDIFPLMYPFAGRS
jgi:hypothetical protein